MIARGDGGEQAAGKKNLLSNTRYANSRLERFPMLGPLVLLLVDTVCILYGFLL